MRAFGKGVWVGKDPEAGEGIGRGFRQREPKCEKLRVNRKLAPQEEGAMTRLLEAGPPVRVGGD